MKELVNSVVWCGSLIVQRTETQPLPSIRGGVVGTRKGVSPL